jgi:hypothetical protein
MPKAVPFAGLAPAALALAAAAPILLGALAGCSSAARFAEGRDLTPAKADPKAKDCSKGGVGCPPTDRRQYYDQRTARYYYFDPQTGRYYWENGDPRF